jgi:hypothetical protein
MKCSLQQFKNLFTAFFIITILSCCHNFYKATTTDTVNVAETSNNINRLKEQNRFFVLRSGTKAYYMNAISLSADKRTLNAVLDTLPPHHRLHLKNGRKGRMQYKKTTNDEAVLTEVHLYIPRDSSLHPGNYLLSLNQVQKIEVVEKDKQRTTGSYVIGAIGYTFGAFAVAAIIIAATKSSCPFVSAYTNNEFVLQGEIYGGAIYPQLARDDYMPLRMEPLADGTLQVKISNELQEKQYTDFADLLVITHQKNSKVLSDEKGNLYEIRQPETPVKAWTSNQPDVLTSVLKANDNSLVHFDDTLATDAGNYLITQFNKPADMKKAKLILSVKNSYWLDYLYGEMAKGFGSYYTTFIKKQHKTPVAQLLKWTKDQKLPLEVSIKTKTGWQKITDLTTIGPLATREIVVSLDLGNIDNKLIEIKLSSGFMFWEMDYAAIDYSDNKTFEVQRISPSIATDEGGKNVLSQLEKKDGIYLAQPLPGNMVTLKYKSKPQADDRTRSYILHTRGYYEHVRDFKGAPNIGFLNQFKQPNAFPLFSLRQYKKFSTTSMQSLAKQ